MVTVLTENGTKHVTGGTGTNGELWIPKSEAVSLTGWTLKPEGFCKGELCVAIQPDRESEFVRGDAVNVAAFWEKMGLPALHDEAGANWVLGQGAAHRSAALQSLEAPDFTLPDLDGNLHSLSDLRGKKVFLVAWASW